METDRVQARHGNKVKYRKIMDVLATNEVEFEKVDRVSDLGNWLFFK